MNARKRSAYVGFSALSLSALVLAGCDRPEQPRVYSSVADCKAEHPAQACDAAWQASVGEHQSTAPQFTQKEQCEAQYGVGHCETGHNEHGGFFMPMMAGFMIGHMMNSGSGYRSNYVGHPVFYNSGGGYRAPNIPPGEGMFTRSGSTTSRGGFGRTAGFHGFSGFGRGG